MKNLHLLPTTQLSKLAIKIEDTINMKQKTLEEVAENFWLNDDSMTDNDRITYVNGFVQGAKWQSERMYSGEEVENIIAETWIQCVGNDGSNFKKLRDKILKQFKNK